MAGLLGRGATSANMLNNLQMEAEFQRFLTRNWFRSMLPDCAMQLHAEVSPYLGIPRENICHTPNSDVTPV